MKHSLLTVVLLLFGVGFAAPTAEAQVPDADFFYDFEEGEGVEVLDSGPDANHGELFGDVVWEEGGCIVSAADEPDGCVRFVEDNAFGTLAFVGLPFDERFNSPNYTYSVWVKWEGTEPDWGYVIWGNGTVWPEAEDLRHVDMYWHPNNRAFVSTLHTQMAEEFHVRYQGDDIGVDPFDGEWHHVVATLDDALAVWQGATPEEHRPTTPVLVNARSSVQSYTDTVRRFAGPSDDLRNVITEVPPEERFTSFYDRDDDGLIEAGELSAIDHILLSPRLFEQLREVIYVQSHDPRTYTDHFPIVVTLED